MQKIWTLAKKELTSHLDNVGGYVLIGLFELVAYYFFFKTFFLSGEITVEPLFADLSWLLCVLVAAVVMGSLASERDKMTIECLLTKPLTSAQLLWGKIWGNFMYVLIPLLLTLPIPLLVSTLGSLDWGVVVASYIGAALMTFSLVCIGVAISASCKKPFIAFVVTAAVLLLLNVISTSWFAVNLPMGLAAFLSKLGLMDHYFNLLRGVLDLADVAYFVLLSGVGVAVGYISITLWRVNKIKLPTAQILGLVSGVLILAWLAFFEHSWLQLRADLTATGRYTLSQVTKDVLREGDPIKVEVYLTANLPAQFQGMVTELRRLLSDYEKAAGRSMLAVNFIDPTGKEEELRDLGLFPTPFSIVSNDSFQQQNGFVAAIISNQEDPDKSQVVNFLGMGGNLDYELTKTIMGIKDREKVTVGYLTGAGEIDWIEAQPTLAQYLGIEMMFEEVRLPAVGMGEEPDPSDLEGDRMIKSEDREMVDLSEYRALIIDQPFFNYTIEAKEAIKDYYEAGGNILMMANGHDIDLQMMLVRTDKEERMREAQNPADARDSEYREDALDLLADLGVRWNNDLVADYQNYSLVSGGNSYTMIPYEYWVRAQKVSEEGWLAGLPEEVTLFWPSSLELTGEDWQALYQSSRVSIATSGAMMTSVMPDWDPEREIGGTPQVYTLAAEKTNEAGGRLVAIANTMFIKDELLQGGGEVANNNLVLGMMILENLASSVNLSQIQARQLGNARMTQDEEVLEKQGWIRVGAPIFSGVMLAGIGGSRYYRRRRLREWLGER
ncbi:Gldg family protein [Microgenomates group bacterium]|nr:Gldg family protein [Microgenomates group bacterium]